MAVVTTKSTQITNRDASPRVLSNARITRGDLHESRGFVEVANGDSIGSKLIMCQVPSTALISRILLSCDAITSAAGDIGVYRTTADGGAVVDVDHFASATSLAAALSNSDVTHEADAADAGAGYGLADTEKPLWQSLGLPADPGVDYDIVITLTAAATAAGTAALKAQFTQ